jgi:hypothetical protein
MNNKHRIAVLLFCIFLVLDSCFAQYNYIQNPLAREFTKRIEYNYYGSGLDNVNSKTDIEKKLFFPEHNSLVEFFILPSFSGSYGFCIDKDNATNKYYLVYKHIANWEQVGADLDKKYPLKSMKMEMWDKSTDEEKKEMSAYNRKIREISRQEALLNYSINNDTLFISQKLATTIHRTFVTLIRDFVGEGNPGTIRDGYRATFRCVVKDEIWYFMIKTPQGTFGKLTELCNQMIESLEKKDFDESKYLSSLNDIVN